MKKLFSFLLLPIAFLVNTSLTVHAQQPAKVTGVWNLNVETSAGSGTPEFTLKHITDSTLEGTYRGQLGETPVKGTLKGNKVYIRFGVSGIDIEYAGIVDGDTMKGKVTLGNMGEGTFTGTRKKG